MTTQNVHTLQEHIANITEDFETYGVTKFDSDGARIAVVDFKCAGERWVSIICEDQAGEITQTNIVGDKAISLLAAVLSK